MIIYCDGSAHPNPGPGGFGVVIINEDNQIKTYAEAKEYTTNNEMELRAIIWSMCYGIINNQSSIHIYSDSAYAINSFSIWGENWKTNGWIKKDGNIPSNLEYIKAFFELSQNINVEFTLVKGHAGNKYNEMADHLATSI